MNTELVKKIVDLSTDESGLNTTLFAELMVRECLDVINKTNTHHAYTTFDLDMIKSTIRKSEEAVKKHFGVIYNA